MNDENSCNVITRNSIVHQYGLFFNNLTQSQNNKNFIAFENNLLFNLIKEKHTNDYVVQNECRGLHTDMGEINSFTTITNTLDNTENVGIISQYCKGSNVFDGSFNCPLDRDSTSNADYFNANIIYNASDNSYYSSDYNIDISRNIGPYSNVSSNGNNVGVWSVTMNDTIQGCVISNNADMFIAVNSELHSTSTGYSTDASYSMITVTTPDTTQTVLLDSSYYLRNNINKLVQYAGAFNSIQELKQQNNAVISEDNLSFVIQNPVITDPGSYKIVIGTPTYSSGVSVQDSIYAKRTIAFDNYNWFSNTSSQRDFGHPDTASYIGDILDNYFCDNNIGYYDLSVNIIRKSNSGFHLSSNFNNIVKLDNSVLVQNADFMKLGYTSSQYNHKLNYTYGNVSLPEIFNYNNFTSPFNFTSKKINLMHDYFHINLSQGEKLLDGANVPGSIVVSSYSNLENGRITSENGNVSTFYSNSNISYDALDPSCCNVYNVKYDVCCVLESMQMVVNSQSTFPFINSNIMNDSLQITSPISRVNLLYLQPDAKVFVIEGKLQEKLSMVMSDKLSLNDDTIPYIPYITYVTNYSESISVAGTIVILGTIEEVNLCEFNYKLFLRNIDDLKLNDNKPKLNDWNFTSGQDKFLQYGLLTNMAQTFPNDIPAFIRSDPSSVIDVNCILAVNTTSDFSNDLYFELQLSWIENGTNYEIIINDHELTHSLSRNPVSPPTVMFPLSQNINGSYTINRYIVNTNISSLQACVPFGNAVNAVLNCPMDKYVVTTTYYVLLDQNGNVLPSSLLNKFTRNAGTNSNPIVGNFTTTYSFNYVPTCTIAITPDMFKIFNVTMLDETNNVVQNFIQDGIYGIATIETCQRLTSTLLIELKNTSNNNVFIYEKTEYYIHIDDITHNIELNYMYVDNFDDIHNNMENITDSDNNMLAAISAVTKLGSFPLSFSSIDINNNDKKCTVSFNLNGNNITLCEFIKSKLLNTSGFTFVCVLDSIFNINRTLGTTEADYLHTINSVTALNADVSKNVTTLMVDSGVSIVIKNNSPPKIQDMNSFSLKGQLLNVKMCGTANNAYVSNSINNNYNLTNEINILNGLYVNVPNCAVLKIKLYRGIPEGPIVISRTSDLVNYDITDANNTIVARCMFSNVKMNTLDVIFVNVASTFPLYNIGLKCNFKYSIAPNVYKITNGSYPISVIGDKVSINYNINGKTNSVVKDLSNYVLLPFNRSDNTQTYINLVSDMIRLPDNINSIGYAFHFENGKMNITYHPNFLDNPTNNGNNYTATQYQASNIVANNIYFNVLYYKDSVIPINPYNKANTCCYIVIPNKQILFSAQSCRNNSNWHTNCSSTNNNVYNDLGQEAYLPFSGAFSDAGYMNNCLFNTSYSNSVTTNYSTNNYKNAFSLMHNASSTRTAYVTLNKALTVYNFKLPSNTIKITEIVGTFNKSIVLYDGLISDLVKTNFISDYTNPFVSRIKSCKFIISSVRNPIKNNYYSITIDRNIYPESFHEDSIVSANNENNNLIITLNSAFYSDDAFKKSPSYTINVKTHGTKISLYQISKIPYQIQSYATSQNNPASDLSYNVYVYKYTYPQINFNHFANSDANLAQTLNKWINTMTPVVEFKPFSFVYSYYDCNGNITTLPNLLNTIKLLSNSSQAWQTAPKSLTTVVPISFNIIEQNLKLAEEDLATFLCFLTDPTDGTLYYNESNVFAKQLYITMKDVYNIKNVFGASVYRITHSGKVKTIGVVTPSLNIQGDTSACNFDNMNLLSVESFTQNFV